MGMETRKFTQFGTLSIILIFPFFVLFTIQALHSIAGNDFPGFYVQISLALILLVCLLVFYKLTIEVNEDTISFKLGLGWFRKTYKISDIESCNPVRNPFFYGIGIRIIPEGFLYNVSGLRSIELRFKNKKSVVRIGTDKPEEICQLIQSLLVQEKTIIISKT